MSIIAPTVLVWFRNDLRLHDHEPLHRAWQSGLAIAAVYCYDPRQFDQTSQGFAKTGAWRGHFLQQSVQNLAASLQSLGSQLLVTTGLPEQIIPEIASKINAKTVYYHQEVTQEELDVERSLVKQLATLGIQAEGHWGSTLYHPEDLPFSIQDLPDLFTNFRKSVEKKKIPVRPCFPIPSQLSPIPDIQFKLTPPPSEFFAVATTDARSVLAFQGGETAGLARLKEYFWDGDRLKIYKETRNGMVGADYSSKFSPWLALGCLSPRFIYQEVKRYEQERISNDSTYWLIFELLWRDFFRFVAQKYGDRLFNRGGLLGKRFPWQRDQVRFELWRSGQTGYPLVDANMRELNLTGFMSNRGRQNVASFLCKNLGIDWRWGAEWFESCLIDYDVCSNWGNWNYTAGIGNDARDFRYFNIPKQSQQYDPQGAYLRRWLPELKSLPGEKIHQPWLLSATEQKQWGVRLGVDYPRPCVDFHQSLEARRKIEQAGDIC
ncbi:MULTISPECIES: DASH family cryptochrome [unclassified Synechocystis]|uniref:DASH family cryptochrome n=1 Tax=unclassified Synechocystis TaxID=2640012 RepID=UPI00041D9343|nr:MULTISPECIES: DASH family cryptochrome [unclassified Synechocystis]AIE75937.1 Cryptochrome [Synechocystis sp. PCC 6714]MCT0255146.1 DASH family cryptochrome [Synechocystis sp. CS-94]